MTYVQCRAQDLAQTAMTNEDDSDEHQGTVIAREVAPANTLHLLSPWPDLAIWGDSWGKREGLPLIWVPSHHLADCWSRKPMLTTGLKKR